MPLLLTDYIEINRGGTPTAAGTGTYGPALIGGLLEAASKNPSSADPTTLSVFEGIITWFGGEPYLWNGSTYEEITPDLAFPDVGAAAATYPTNTFLLSPTGTLFANLTGADLAHGAGANNAALVAAGFTQISGFGADTFASLSQAGSAGTDTNGNAYTAGSDLITFPGGDTLACNISAGTVSTSSPLSGDGSAGSPITLSMSDLESEIDPATAAEIAAISGSTELIMKVGGTLKCITADDLPSSGGGGGGAPANIFGSDGQTNTNSGISVTYGPFSGDVFVSGRVDATAAQAEVNIGGSNGSYGSGYGQGGSNRRFIGYLAAGDTIRLAAGSNGVDGAGTDIEWWPVT